MSGNEYNYFQLSPIDVANMTNAGAGQQTRSVHMRMSNFGALAFGTANSSDYTIKTKEFSSKLENQRSREFEDSALANENPLVAGSTVKYSRDDQFFRSGMSTGAGAGGFISVPRKDVMDTNVVTGSMTSGKNYPTEGWRSFGGKYDFAVAYDGMVH